MKTGKTPITLTTYLAIMSISLVVNLPGLAVTPMLGTLSTVFPHTTQLEKQLLTVLPNLLIIPFVLLSGKLSLTRHKIAVVFTGLIVFAGCAIGYLFAHSMTELIIYSCLLGCGAGLLIPLATGLIADTFSGRYRMTQMGIKSGISNSSLVVATLAVGWLSHGGWHLPFIVYLIALVPLVLAVGLRGIPSAELNPAPLTGDTNTMTDPVTQKPKNEKIVKGFYINRVWSLIAVYAFITFATIAITYYGPFFIEKHNWSVDLTGTITSIFFLFILIPGFTISWIVKVLKGLTFFVCALSMTAGLALFAFIPEPWAICVGSALAGFGYGTCQPLIYDKASRAVTSDNKATLALSFVLTANYLAVVLTPFILDGIRDIFHAGNSTIFVFMVCFILLTVFSVMTFIFRNSFALAVRKDYY